MKFYAEGGTRTHTPVRTLRPEHSMSTNSITSASEPPNIYIFSDLATDFLILILASDLEQIDNLPIIIVVAVRSNVGRQGCILMSTIEEGV